MARLRGEGLGTGMALGTAALIRVRSGIPIRPEVPARMAQQTMARKASEPPDIILVAEDYKTAFALIEEIPWGRVVGIAAGFASPDAPVTPVPAVMNVPNLMSSVEEDMLLLVDAGRGIVLADPDPVALANYTAEHEQLTLRRRFHLENVHLPAQTLDGRTIQVLARVNNSQDVAAAVAEGADVLFVPYDASLLPFQSDETTQRRELLALVERAAGKPLIIADEYALSPEALVEAASLADMTLALPPREDLEGFGLREFAEEMRAALQEREDKDKTGDLPRLAATLAYEQQIRSVPNARELVETVAGSGATRIVFSLEQESLDIALIPSFDAVVAAAGENLLPVFFSCYFWTFSACGVDELSESLQQALLFVIGTGAAGITVEPNVITAVKAFIRDRNAEECRKELWALAEQEGTA